MPRAAGEEGAPRGGAAPGVGGCGSPMFWRRAGWRSVDGEVQGVVVAGLADHGDRVAAGGEGDGAPDVDVLVHAGGLDLEGRFVVVGQLRGAAGDGELGLEFRADLEPV